MFGLNDILTHSLAYAMGEDEGRAKARKEDNNPWHTGTPTEEGCFYVLQCKGKNHPEPYYGVVVDGTFYAISYTGELTPLPPDLIAWQKIEPYKKETENGL